ncbi:MAG: RNase adaptor protein RapZ, partial [Actinobacteria bacterium]|nr:RNase adaptor protein RapZ [Actinomycetota bacterium]MBT4303276.1 RNase adaptor protein RapZ [Actinomycetota bacterium]MBT4477385.1 RNase adaptor protein RapZ [Actinomycetota bacterium]MBT4657009.1 RNase adaptor protein RapZ [Actinomycetota bacterium]MBT5084390.1 RNase adaptor protein RapZ [Actinomycetota bacterium]
GRSFLSLAFGCTGGHHRSVAITETVVGHLRDQGFDPLVTHRDINR